MKSRAPTPLERQIVPLVAAGLNNREIAAQLGTTENVIKNHVRNLYDKLGFDNRVELALWYEAQRFKDTQSQSLADRLIDSEMP